MDSAHSFFIRKLWQACVVLGFQAGDGVSKAHNEMHVGQHGCDGLDVPSLDHVAGAGFNRKLRHRETEDGLHVWGERRPHWLLITHACTSGSSIVLFSHEPCHECVPAS